MFTGLIESIGTVRKALHAEGRLRLHVALPGKAWKGVTVGESIAIDGVCLTVTQCRGGVAVFDVVGETLKRTTLGTLQTGGKINLERAMRSGDRLGGHFVTGHVDGLGRIRKITKAGGDLLFEFSAPASLMPEIGEKGSVAVDGISLTVVSVLRGGFTVTIIPHTLEATTLGGKAVKDPVNLESDVLAKYVRRAFESLRKA